MGPLGRPGTPYDGTWMVHLRGPSAASALGLPCPGVFLLPQCQLPRLPLAGSGAPLQWSVLFTQFCRGAVSRGQRRARHADGPTGAARHRSAHNLLTESAESTVPSKSRRRSLQPWHLRGGNTRSAPAGRGRGAFWGLFAVSRPGCRHWCNCKFDSREQMDRPSSDASFLGSSAGFCLLQHVRRSSFSGTRGLGEGHHWQRTDCPAPGSTAAIDRRSPSGLGSEIFMMTMRSTEETRRSGYRRTPSRQCHSFRSPIHLAPRWELGRRPPTSAG